jgi:hypothetical protein
MDAILTSALAIALASSPLIGGGHSNNDNWRWIFCLKYLNSLDQMAQKNHYPAFVPGFMDSIPVGSMKRSIMTSVATSFWQADIVGAFLLLGTVAFLVAALEEGGIISFSWGSGVIIASFVVSGRV